MQQRIAPIVLLAALAACEASPAKPHHELKAAPAEAAMQMQMPKPSAEHAIVMKMAGTWDLDVEAEGQKSKAVQTLQPVGDFWVAGSWDGQMMGAPFHGHQMTGYDATKKEFITVWVDSMSPSLFHSNGQYDAATRTLTMTIRGDMGGQEMVMNEVTKFRDDDHYSTTMTMTGPDGQPMQPMRFEAARRK